MADPFILPLDAVGRADRAQVGGKAAHLGELLRAGFPVPPGFCLTVGAYRAMLAQDGLGARLAAALAGLDPADPDARQRAAAAVRAAWDAASLPDALAAALEWAYRDLVAPEPDGPVAVRSSATLEDAAGASFAGQGETFLDVRGVAALHAAVRGCWASFWSSQALAYRARLQPGADDAPGVLVQRMVAPEVAGVLFTADPVTGATDWLVVEAVPGLGEALVQGETTPERYVLGRPDLAVREWTAAPGRAGALLSVAQAQDLARLGLRMANWFGAPQDVEWALVQGSPVILQSRPITTPPPAATAPSPPASAILPPRMPQMLAERFPDPPTPFDVSAALGPVLGSVGALPRRWSRSLPFVEQDGVVVGLAPSGRFAGELWLRLATLLAVSWRYRTATWFQEELPALERALATLEAVDLAACTDQEVAAYLSTVSERMEAGFRARWRSVAAALRTLAPLLVLLRFLEGPRAAATLGDLLAGLPTVTTTMNAELARLAQQIAASPRLAALFRDLAPEDLERRLAQDEGDPVIADFQRALAAFLARYGARETGGFGVANPSWQDDPAVVLATLASLAQAGNLRSGSESAALAQAAQARVLARLVGPLRALRGPFLKALTGAREAYRLREDSHFHLMRFLPLLRRGALELGRRWTARGLLREPEEVFLLKLKEVAALARGEGQDLRPLLERRARRRAQARQSWVRARGDVQTDGAPGAVLHATGASRGVAIGRARLIRDEREFHRLRPGEILVAPYTSPSWTPLFAVAAGVIAETGALLSHAAIVAREYGIPAVVGLAGATHLLHDGELLAVDGERGAVRRLDLPMAPDRLPVRAEPARTGTGGRRILPWAVVGTLALGLLALLARRLRHRGTAAPPGA
ncbi:MAG: hypothetical protein HY689_06960 [Chloroflexi bacterium]|nr:hypothetical protein [Chloroflexota bacterium]